MEGFTIDTETGKKCLRLSGRALYYSWPGSSFLWRWYPKNDSRSLEAKNGITLNVFKEETYCQVETRMLSPNTTYEVYYVFGQLTEDACGFYNGKGSIRFVDRVAEAVVERKIEFDTTRSADNITVHRMRDDEYLEIKLGEFVNNLERNEEVEVGFLAFQGWAKGGEIKALAMEFRPKQPIVSSP